MSNTRVQKHLKKVVTCVIDVTFSGETSKTIEGVKQWSTGVMLKVTGLVLKDKFTVSYSHNTIDCSVLSVERLAKTYRGISIIPVPNYLLTKSGTITVMFSGKTIIVPVLSENKPQDYDKDCMCDVDVDRAMIDFLLEKIEQGSGESTDEIDGGTPDT